MKAKNVKRIEDENQKTLRIWAQSYEKAHKPIENFNHKPLKLEKTDLIEILEILNKSGNDKTEKFNTDDFSKIIDEITQYLNKNNER